MLGMIDLLSSLNAMNGVNGVSRASSDTGAKVIDGVYIGSLTTAKSITRENNPHDIDVIINLSGEQYNTHLPAIFINMNDQVVAEADIRDFMTKFAVGVKLIKKYRANGKRVLVHCQAGINRSATLILFYLINIGWSYDNAVLALTVANKIRNVPLLTNYTFRYMARCYEASSLFAIVG